MKYLIAILSIVFLLGACTTTPTEEEYPTDLAAQKTLLKKTKKELREAKQLIEKLEADITKQEPPKEKTRRLVTSQAVAKKDFKRYIDIQGTIQTDDIAMASSEMGGRITSVKVKEGSYVKKGQLIATTDMESVDKQIAELQKSLELAKDVYERQKRLWDQNIGSEIQYLQAKNNKERLEKGLESVNFQLTKANVYAPISGTIDQVFSKTGEMAGPGTPIVQILNTANVKVVADVPERYLTAIKRGEKVTVKFPALEKESTAKVSMIGRSINPGNRTFKVEANVSNRDKMLKPNLLASMMVNDFTQKDAIIVPLEIVQQDVSGKSFVYIVDKGKDGAFAKKVFIKTGESYQDEIIVNSGLTGKEELVMQGARNLTANELIKIDSKVVAENKK